MLAEAKDLRKRIQVTKDRLTKIEDEGMVMDSVVCGSKGKKPLGTVRIKGFPLPEYSKVKTDLQRRQLKLTVMEMDLLELTNDVEEYIDNLPDSRMRRIMRFKYIDDMGWIKVAANIGGKATPDSVRMEHDRYLAREEVSSICSDNI